jgi:hypothetical protein
MFRQGRKPFRLDVPIQERFPVFRTEDQVNVKFGQGLGHEELLLVRIYVALSELCSRLNSWPRATRWPLASACLGLDY